jgi:PadR family transcriptional regulator PadR
MDNFETSLKKGVIEMLILSVIDSGEKYSREITKSLAKGGVIISDGTFYPLINRMRKEGLVKYRIVEDSSGIIKKYYSVSEKGSTQLSAMLQQWKEFSQSINLIIKD